MNENPPKAESAVVVVRSLADFRPLHAAEARVVAGYRAETGNPQGVAPRDIQSKMAAQNAARGV